MREFVFAFTCASAPGAHEDVVRDLGEMTDDAKPVTLETFRRHCDWRPWAEGCGYSIKKDGGPPLSRDHHVAFFKSRWRGSPCYYAVWSAYECVFLREKDYHA